MTTLRYGLSTGETEFAVREEVGVAVVNDSMEFTVDLAGTGLLTGAGKNKVLLALDMIKNHIVKGNWPPI